MHFKEKYLCCCVKMMPSTNALSTFNLLRNMFEIFAPGRGGETLKFINRVSGARVNCSKDRGHGLEEKGKITINGTRKEIQSAKVRF